MRENEERGMTRAEQKELIRARYRGVEFEELEMIPALPQATFYEDKSVKRVGVYARVSTDDPRQTSSYELQKNHYQDVIARHEGWQLIDIYADEGISGTSLQHRDEFVRMIGDCKAHKLDLIVTKSVSRFARNVLDCIGYVRQLAAMTPPIGVFFETENIYTLNPNSEMSLSFISTLAQEESHNKSEIMNASIEMRFRRGIFLTPPLLGYDVDTSGNLVVNEEEAKTVRLIFFMYLYGYTCKQIGETLSSLGRRTKKGNTTWSPGSILQILQNERHCGDVLARKTWTPSYLDHKSKKNKQNRNQWIKREHHEPIIARDDWLAVQQLIRNAKYKNKGLLPELHVIPEGALKGFVPVNPRWAGFKAQDYKLASSSVYDEIVKLPSAPLEITANQGDFDLRGFEIARGQYFNTANKCCVTFSISSLHFSTECVRKFEKTLFVEMLVHPNEHLFAVRPSTKENRRAVKWANADTGLYCKKDISGAAFLPTLFELFGWDPNCRYRIQGIRRQKGDETVIIFDVRETEILIPAKGLPSADIDSEESVEALPRDVEPIGGGKHSIVAYPADWIEGFGRNYYTHAQARELAAFESGEWSLDHEGVEYDDGNGLNVTATDQLCTNIQDIIGEMKQEAVND